tara:strand:+ start:535 stop:1644 length:1110 start_codon:yes stop_codon:yes gene_type:complete
LKTFTIIYLLLISLSTKAQCNGSPILCNKHYNNVAFLTTHNSFNSEEGNFSLPNQNFNIVTQLNNGVRALMLDVYDSGGIPMVYHGSAILGSNPLLDYLNQINLFLSNNTNEIITIILECYTDANSIENVINQAGLNNFLYTHDSINSWPTLQTMINNNNRLVIFSDVDDASANQPWYHYIWDYAVETHYSVNNQNDFNCDFNRGDSINDLFIFNHFVTTILGTGDENASLTANSNPFFLNRAVQCQQEKNKFPNFITVDFYDLGSTNEVVNFLNGIITTINENNLNHSEHIKVNPNPIASTLKIEVSKRIKKPFSLKIINDMGKQVAFIKDINNNTVSLDNSFNSGIYFILIEDNKRKTYTSKFISTK